MNCLALDACCLLNLAAAGRILHEDSSDIGFSFFVPDVVAQEAVYILQPDEERAENFVKKEVNIDEYVQRRLLSYCEIEGTEEARLYVQFAVQLDDGEASCLAIAKSRSWAIASDDRVARRIATEFGIPVLGTPEIVKFWAERCSIPDSDIASAIADIQRFAKYVPRNVPDSDWWFQKLLHQ